MARSGEDDDKSTFWVIPGKRQCRRYRLCVYVKDGASRVAIYLPETGRLKAFPKDRRCSQGGMLVAILTREETGPPGRNEIYLPG